MQKGVVGSNPTVPTKHLAIQGINHMKHSQGDNLRVPKNPSRRVAARNMTETERHRYEKRCGK
jgi:hypothetical protein